MASGDCAFNVMDVVSEQVCIVYWATATHARPMSLSLHSFNLPIHMSRGYCSRRESTQPPRTASLFSTRDIN